MDDQSESFVPEIEVRLASREDLGKVGELARLIFPGTYEHIVPPDSIAYMMELFYTPKALKLQFDSGQTFLLLYFKGSAAGYASFTRLNDDGDFKLNKIYLDNRLQGKGLGRFLLSDIVRRIKSEGGRSLTLNVNKHNRAVGFYRNLGFHKVKEELLDIGDGHFMDDYVLKMKLI
jgi:ribosomal protein S18 acetylase RimI-like enzyme